MKERNNYTNELSPNSGVKFDPPLNPHNSKVERINRNEKIPETDPVLWKSKPFTIEKKNFKELQKVREGSSPNKKKQQVQATENSQSMHDSILAEKNSVNLSPIHKLFYKEASKKYRESSLYDIPVLNNFSSNLVLEGSTSNKWRMFYQGTNLIQKFGLSRENNYSNSDFMLDK